MTQLILVRHGETDWNQLRRYQGHTDLPLNESGRRQAQALAAALAELAIDALYASDLQRAVQTAAVLAERKGLPVVQEPALREQCFGVMEGLDAAQMRAQHPQLWDLWQQQPAEFAMPGGGESLLCLHQRVRCAMLRLAAQHAGQRVAVFTHTGVLDMVWRIASSQALSGPRRCAVPNAAINRVRVSGAELHIESWAETAHLGPGG